MKNYILKIIVFVCAFIISVKSFAGDGYIIRIKVSGIKDTVCFLANHYGGKQYYKDTARVDANGVFIFKGDKALPGGIYLVIIPGTKYFEFLVTEQNISIETDTLNLVGNLKVKRSEENKLFYGYIRYINNKRKEIGPLRKALRAIKDNEDSTALLKERIAKIDEEVNNYQLTFIKEHSTTLSAKIFKASMEIKIPETPILKNGRKDSLFAYRYYRAHFFDNVDLSDDRLLRTPIIHNKIIKFIQKMTPQIPDSINKAADFVVEKTRANKEVFKYVVHWITNTYEKSKIMGMDAVFVHMAENYYMTDDVYWIDSTQRFRISERVKTLKPLLIGKKAKNLIMKDVHEKQVYSLHDFSGQYTIRLLSGADCKENRSYTVLPLKARFTILCFWDPDCGHCKKTIPKLEAVYQKYKRDDVEIYGVCTEAVLTKCIAFIEKYNLTWLNVADPCYQNNFRADYDISSTPKIFLLDENKKIIAKQLDVKQLDDFLARLLNKKIEPEQEEGSE
ncbi:MAG: DUF5106 domain-containing protein [Cytophagales bacterium]|nr:DUF5106 domain-containing protein [Cytophagales bacterium]